MPLVLPNPWSQRLQRVTSVLSSVHCDDPSYFRVRVVVVHRLVVALRGSIVLVGVRGCAHLIGLLCVLHRHRASQLQNLGVV
jgi:hypothetical protein